jgi:hypothetical protein
MPRSVDQSYNLSAISVIESDINPSLVEDSPSAAISDARQTCERSTPSLSVSYIITAIYPNLTSFSLIGVLIPLV